jgi:hypothetical protein
MLSVKNCSNQWALTEQILLTGKTVPLKYYNYVQVNEEGVL